MIKAKKFLFQISAATLLFGITSIAWAAQSNSTIAGDSDGPFGLPVSATSPQEVVGALPYSNQWISEQTNSFIYVTYNSSQMGSSTMTVGQYVADFGSAGYSFPSVDFFSHITSLAGPESRSSLRDFSLWGRYSFGLADRDGSLSSNLAPTGGSVNDDSLLIFYGRVGLLMGYDHFTWIRPYAGIEVDPYFFRNTSGTSGAEQQGGNFNYGPTIGAHFPVLFSGRGSFLAEYHRGIPLSGSGQLYTNSNNYTAGMGLTF